MSTKAISIGGRRVGAGEPVLVIAEAGVNHNGDVELARRLVDAAADVGADAVKFQAFRAELVAAPDAPKADYQRETTDEDESQLEMLRRLELPEDAYRELRDRADGRGVLFLSSVFDEASVALLEQLGAPAIKVGSGELTNRALLARIGASGKPVILSTGMATLEEVERSVDTLHAAGCDQLAVLHATSNYPADPGDANLRALETLRDTLGVPVGYSDHTPGDETALAAVALGAAIVEKHLTLDRSLPGPDHRASLDPGAFRALVAGIRTVERALGDGIKRPADSELATRDVVRRSLVAAQPLATGTTLAPELLVAVRPGTGIPPERRDELVGRLLLRDVAAGEQIAWDDLA